MAVMQCCFSKMYYTTLKIKKKQKTINSPDAPRQTKHCGASGDAGASCFIFQPELQHQKCYIVAETVMRRNAYMGGNIDQRESYATCHYA